MYSIDPRAIPFVLERITNGSIFEQFGKQFIAASQDTMEFVPIGGTWDGGIDGLDYSYTPQLVALLVLYSHKTSVTQKFKLRMDFLLLQATA